MARRPTPLDGRGTWRPALLGAGAGIAGCAFVSMTARLLLHRFQLNPYGPNAWLFGAVFVGILAAGVVFVLGIAPGLSRHRAPGTIRAAEPRTVPPR